MCDAGDSLSFQQGQSFSARDRDNDVGYEHCAQKYKGAGGMRHAMLLISTASTSEAITNHTPMASTGLLGMVHITRLRGSK